MSEPSIRKGILWNAGGNVLYLAAQWIVTVMVTRISGFEDAGILSGAMSISATIQTVALFGVRNFQVSDVRDEFSNSTYFNLRNITCSASLIICILFSIFGNYSLTQLVAILFYMIFRIAESYTDVLSGIAQRNNRLDIVGVSLAIKGVLVLVCFFGGYYAFSSLNAGLGLMALSSCLSTVLYDYVAVKRLSSFRLTDSFKKSMSLAKKVYPLCIYMFLFTSITSAPKLILESMTANELLGAYSSIFAPATLIQTATGYIYNPFATMFALDFKNNKFKSAVRNIIKIALIMLAIALVTLLGAHFFGEFAFKLVFGEGILEYSYLINPIIISTILLSFLGFLCMVEIVVRDFVGIIVGCGVGAFSAGVLSFIMINRFSAQGTSYAIIIATSAAIIITAASLARKIYIMKSKQTQE